MASLQKLPIGIQSFEKLRTNHFLYVDKTSLMYNLVSTEGCYFLARPRRFGKSLLVSMLHAYFDGRRDLFKDLAIEHLENDWVKRPVFHLDLNTGIYNSCQALDDMDACEGNPIAAIYQSVYLTIAGYDEEFALYTLAFPNKEVEEGFSSLTRNIEDVKVER